MDTGCIANGPIGHPGAARGGTRWCAIALALTLTGCFSGNTATGPLPNPGPAPGPGGGGSGTPTAPGSPATGHASIAVPGTTYYVDSVSGDDDNDGLTKGTALRSLAAGADRLATTGGDKLAIAGSFAERLTLAGFNNPTGAQPDPDLPTVIQCQFDNAGQRIPAAIDGGISGAASFPFDKRGLPPGFGSGTGNYLYRGIDLSNSHYVTISGLDVRGIAGRGVSSTASSHLMLEYMTIEWMSESAMVLDNGAKTAPHIEGLTIAHCTMNQLNLGAWIDEATQQGYNMKPEAVSIVKFDGFEVFGNIVSNTLMEGIDFKLGAKNGVVRNNLVENTRSVGIYANEADDTVIARNIVRQIGYYDPQDGSGPGLATPHLAGKVPGVAASLGTVGILVSNGDLAPAPESGRCTNIDIYENVVSWTQKGAVSINNEWRVEGKTGWLLDDIRVFNNVFHKSCLAVGASAVLLDSAVTNCSIVNNIIMDSAKKGILIANANPSGFFATGVIAHNLFYNNFEDGTRGSSSISGNPQFALVPTNLGDPSDFRLLPGSPAIDTGTTIGGLATGGSVPDVGAYQTNLAPWMAGSNFTP